MRGAPLAALLLAGCAQVLGLEDPGTGDACEPLADDSGCPPGQVCDILEPDDVLGCRDVGTAQLGDLCNNGASCAGGLSCVDGVCRTICESSADCGAGEVVCIKDHGVDGQLLVCDSDCDVTGAGGAVCPVGQECILNLNGVGQPLPLCVPDGWFGDRALGAPCDFLSQCEQGLACFDDDNDGTGACTEVCSDTVACPDARTCVMGLFTPVHEVNIGLCALP